MKLCTKLQSHAWNHKPRAETSHGTRNLHIKPQLCAHGQTCWSVTSSCTNTAHSHAHTSGNPGFLLQPCGQGPQQGSEGVLGLPVLSSTQPDPARSLCPTFRVHPSCEAVPSSPRSLQEALSDGSRETGDLAPDVIVVVSGGGTGAVNTPSGACLSCAHPGCENTHRSSLPLSSWLCPRCAELPGAPGAGTLDQQHVATLALQQKPRAQTSWPAPPESGDLRSPGAILHNFWAHILGDRACRDFSLSQDPPPLVILLPGAL